MAEREVVLMRGVELEERYELSPDEIEVDVVRCRSCGDYVEVEDAVVSGGRTYCRRCVDGGWRVGWDSAFACWRIEQSLPAAKGVYWARLEWMRFATPEAAEAHAEAMIAAGKLGAT